MFDGADLSTFYNRRCEGGRDILVLLVRTGALASPLVNEFVAVVVRNRVLPTKRLVCVGAAYEQHARRGHLEHSDIILALLAGLALDATQLDVLFARQPLEPRPLLAHRGQAQVVDKVSCAD